MITKAIVKLTGDVMPGDLQKVFHAAKEYKVLRDCFMRFEIADEKVKLFSSVEMNEAANELTVACENGPRAPRDMLKSLAGGFESAFGNADFAEGDILLSDAKATDIEIKHRLVGYSLRFVEP